MSESTGAKQFSVKSENILTPKEAEVLQLSDRGDLSCPRCSKPLYGDKLVEEGIYISIILVCLEGCGFREY